VSYSFLLGALLNEKLPWSGNTETAPFEPFLYENDIFTKTGSGQT
jgi:hypothetical protein